METLQRTANRGSLSTGYDIDNSLKIEGGAAERMQRASESIGTPTSTKIATISLWVKRTELKSSGNNFCWLGNAGAVTSFIGFNDDCLRWISDVSNAGVLKSDAVFRDTSSWYHIVFAFDTTQSTASNRIKAYVNGVQITSWSTETYPNQDNVIGIYETNMSHYIGWEDSSAQAGYFADVYLIDGQQLAPTEFGEFDSDTGIWIPKAYTGTFGDEGYYLDFEDSSSLGADVSGNSNNFANLYNITAADQATDTPTNNFCTFNPLSTFAGNFVVSEGATKIQQSSGNSGYKTHCATIGVTVGKWYAEFKAGTGWGQGSVGVNQLENSKNWEEGYIGQYSNSTAIGMGYMNDGQFARNGGTGAIGSTYTAGDIIGIALLINSDGTGFMGMHKNGTWQNSQDPSSGTTGMLGLYYGNPLPDGMFHTFAVTTRHDNGPWLANFGGYPGFTISSGNSDANGYGNFEYAVPTGYYALCTKNLAEYG